jgi:hypothetical protein
MRESPLGQLAPFPAVPHPPSDDPLPSDDLLFSQPPLLPPPPAPSHLRSTIRVAGKLVTRCAEPYAEGDLVTVQLDMEAHKIEFLKNGLLQAQGDGLPDEVGGAYAPL